MNTNSKEKLTSKTLALSLRKKQRQTEDLMWEAYNQVRKYEKLVKTYKSKPTDLDSIERYCAMINSFYDKQRKWLIRLIYYYNQVSELPKVKDYIDFKLCELSIFDEV